MKKLLLAGIAGAAAVAASTPVQAHPTYHYVGGCGFFTISDGTDDSQTEWTGEVHAAVVATDAVSGAPAAVSISVECELRINGATPGEIVYSTSTPGTGVAAGGDEFVFHADPDDVVTMCDNVTVGTNFHKDCGDATTTPIVPDPVREALDEHVWPTVDPTIEEIDETIVKIDQMICDTVIIPLDESAVDDGVTIDIRTDGDIYVNGIWFWDCPVYGESGS